MDITITSSTGSGEDSCLNVVFSGGSDSITCRAVVTWSLVGHTHIQLHPLNSSGDGHFLTENIPNENTTDFTCTVCITVPESNIENHCSSDTLSTSSTGECTTCTVTTAVMVTTIPYHPVPIQNQVGSLQ